MSSLWYILIGDIWSIFWCLSLVQLRSVLGDFLCCFFCFVFSWCSIESSDMIDSDLILFKYSHRICALLFGLITGHNAVITVMSCWTIPDRYLSTVLWRKKTSLSLHLKSVCLDRFESHRIINLLFFKY